RVDVPGRDSHALTAATLVGGAPGVKRRSALGGAVERDLTLAESAGGGRQHEAAVELAALAADEQAARREALLRGTVTDEIEQAVGAHAADHAIAVAARGAVVHPSGRGAVATNLDVETALLLVLGVVPGTLPGAAEIDLALLDGNGWWRRLGLHG